MKKVVLLTLLSTAALFSRASAEPINVQIDRSVQKYNLGLSGFGAGKGAEGSVNNVRTTVVDDLKFSRLFNLVESGPFVKNRKDASQWASIGSEVVLGGDVRRR